MDHKTAEKDESGTTANNADDVISILNIGEDKADEVAAQKAKDRGGERPGLMAFYQRLNDKVQSLTSIDVKDRVSFFQLLAIMIEAGVPLIRALYVLSEQVKNVRLRKIIAVMAGKVENGKTLSDAMEDFSGIFSDAQIGMIRAGEASGTLNGILKQVATQAEKSAAVASKVKGAMIYPAVVMTIMFGAVMVILGMVVPKLMDLFNQTNAELPLSTQILIGASDFVVDYYQFIAGAIVVFLGLIYLWKRTESGKYHWHNLMLHLPVFGKLIRNVSIARFTRTLSSLLSSGIPIVKSLQIDADAVGNEVYRRRIYLAAEDVSRGIPLAENLTDSQKLFPEMVVSMIAVGEQTAELHTV
ncbi:MAG: type II secretion system F family protein, partial [Candidatus Peregrinibacteria bacterium]|nr:type II secretion system F family protein [Candidatus Peregrinibacteria bacterium]